MNGLICCSLFTIDHSSFTIFFRKGVIFMMKRGINAAGHKRYYVLRRKLGRVLLSVL